MPKRSYLRIIDSRRENAATTIAGVTLSAPASGVTEHGMLLGLEADDHPQYLRADGARSLQGNLSVAAGATIDGVDISAHAGDPAAHHAPATAGDGISITNQQVAVNSTVVRATRQVVAGGGLTGGGALSADITLALQTPGTLSVSSTNSSAGAHTHALTSSSNPGAAASILASDSSGYLQLTRLGLGKSPTLPLDVSGGANISGALSAGSANISGSATVIGDLSVGTVLQVNTAGTRVGINRAADQQFDLDVAGAIRGQYLVGRHAIQLASAVGVWHFDGAAPYNLDYTGSNASHAGLSGTESGGVIYRPGRYGKAVQVGESTTNYCPDPSSEGTSAWVAQYNGSGYLTGGQSTDYALYGVRSYKITATQATWTGAYNAAHYQVGGAAAWNNGETNTISCYVRGTGTWRIVFEDNSETLRQSQQVVLSGTWQRVVVTAPNTSGTNYTETRVAVFSETAGTIYIDGVQIERKSYVTPYCDGGLGAGHSWSGTAHASSSTRVSGSITYNIDARQSTQWTIMCWRKLDAFPDNTTSWSIRWYSNTSGYRQLVLAYRNAENLWRWYASIEDSGGTARTGFVDKTDVGTWTAWHHLAMTVNVAAGIIKAYLDGILIGTATIPNINNWYANPWNTLTLYHSGAASGLVDELVLLDYEADPKLIRAIYESDAPVFVESSVFHWRSPSRVPIWVDEFGLWARGVSGNEILGLYGGDPRNPTGNVTKSWGGITMEENDIVIGRAAQAAVHWDDSAGTLLIGQPSAANMLLSGGALRIRSGSTDKIVLDSSGNASFTGEITATGGSISGTLNISAGGKIVAGGGVVNIDVDGIQNEVGTTYGNNAAYSFSSGGSTCAGVWAQKPSGGLDVLIGANTNNPNSTSNYVFGNITSGITIRSTVYAATGFSANVVLESRNAQNGTRVGIDIQNSASTGATILFSHTPVVGSSMHTVWHKGNDGSGTGLDADLLDGMHASSFLRSDASLGSWAVFSFSSGWANYGNGYHNCQYRKYGDVVALRGLAAASSTNATITTLPTGYRPAAKRLLLAWVHVPGSGSAARRINIDTAGNVQADDWTPASGTIVSFDEIQFSV